MKLGDQQLTGGVTETPGQPVALGRVTLPPGRFDIAVEGTAIQGGELMRLRGLHLSLVDR